MWWNCCCSYTADCSVCLEKIDYFKKHKMPCGHTFHCECIKSWLVKSNTCPECRATICYSITMYLRLCEEVKIIHEDVYEMICEKFDYTLSSKIVNTFGISYYEIDDYIYKKNSAHFEIKKILRVLMAYKLLKTYLNQEEWCSTITSFYKLCGKIPNTMQKLIDIRN